MQTNLWKVQIPINLNVYNKEQSKKVHKRIYAYTIFQQFPHNVSNISLELDNFVRKRRMGMIHISNVVGRKALYNSGGMNQELPRLPWGGMSPNMRIE